jgi:tRNA threonylcarbamoyladenosine biosynthesis protein TsaE
VIEQIIDDWSIIELMNIAINSEAEMSAFGVRLGSILTGGEVLELVGDVGAGKTTLTKGIALGLGVDEDVQSPSFTISCIYEGRDDLHVAHYDFYRLQDAGIMGNELAETIHDPNTVTILEWGGIVDGILPVDRMTITIVSPSETSRGLSLSTGGLSSQAIMEQL